MKGLIGKSALALVMLLMMFTFGLWQGSTAKAKANVTWTTTSVRLDSGKFTIDGYFKNTGDKSGTVSKLRFVNYSKHCPFYIGDNGHWNVLPTVFLK